MATVKIKTTKVEQPKRVRLNTYLTHITSRHLGGKKTYTSQSPFHVQSVCIVAYFEVIQFLLYNKIQLFVHITYPGASENIDQRGKSTLDIYKHEKCTKQKNTAF